MDFKQLIRDEMDYQRRRLYKRLKTSDGNLVVEYWNNAEAFLNSVQGISWEKTGNKILIKEKVHKMKSFRDILEAKKDKISGINGNYTRWTNANGNQVAQCPSCDKKIIGDDASGQMETHLKSHKK